MELEDEKRSVQLERDRLLAEVESLADGHLHKFIDIHSQKLKSLEAQLFFNIMDLKKTQENQVQLVN
ncbi:hypothetical protein MA16_Dca023304 [Dendrobium catenatum]|uniref:Uncharacterized protein n=1 Tax=Dendrobium catenatum TaxID=906689 RepID=A0A2I0WDY7_9ASPA|nr:hypothetical protein MA16_Dca023304 [Dendrobium catenatum]